MHLEIEAKFYPVEPVKFRARLKRAGAKLMIPKRKMRRVLFGNEANPGIQGSYIRVRDEGNLVRLSLKVHAQVGGKVTDQKEAEVEVSDFDKAVEIMKLAGLAQTNYQETYREEWRLKGAEVVIDWWPGLEPYCEIETDSEEKLEKLAGELGFDWAKKFPYPIEPVYKGVYGIAVEQVRKMIANLTFENNPFAGMKKKRPDFYQLKS